MIEYKVVETRSSESLNSKVKDLISLGWKPVGSHQVVVIHEQLQFSGMQHKATVMDTEYSQTMIKETEETKPLGDFSDKELFDKK